MRDALSVLDMCISYAQGSVDEGVVGSQVLGTSGRASMFEVCRTRCLRKRARARWACPPRWREGPRRGMVFLREIIAHLRALMMVQIVGDRTRRNLLEIHGRGTHSARVSRPARPRPNGPMSVMDIFLDAERDSRYVTRGRVLLEMAITRVCRRGKVEDISGLLTRLDQLEKQIASGAVAAPAGIACARGQVRTRRTAQAQAHAGKRATTRPSTRPRWTWLKKARWNIFCRLARRGELRQVRGDDVISGVRTGGGRRSRGHNEPAEKRRSHERLFDRLLRRAEAHYTPMIQAVEPPRAQAGGLGPDIRARPGAKTCRLSTINSSLSRDLCLRQSKMRTDKTTMQFGGLNQMKIFISSDIEGTAGIVDRQGKPSWSERVGDYFREHMFGVRSRRRAGARWRAARTMCWSRTRRPTTRATSTPPGTA